MKMDRREFLRLGAATTLVGGISLLVLAPRGQACERVVDCSDCEKFDGCGLPRRLRFNAPTGNAANGAWKRALPGGPDA